MILLAFIPVPGNLAGTDQSRIFKLRRSRKPLNQIVSGKRYIISAKLQIPSGSSVRPVFQQYNLPVLISSERSEVPPRGRGFQHNLRKHSPEAIVCIFLQKCIRIIKQIGFRKETQASGGVNKTGREQKITGSNAVNRPMKIRPPSMRTCLFSREMHF